MKRIGQILIGIGIIIILIPLVGRIYTYYVQRQLYNEYLQKWQIESNEQVASSSTLTHEHNSQLNFAMQEKTEGAYTFENSEVMGKVIIHSINLDLLLLEGESEANLKLGACHMQGTAYPGEWGNCAIAGHRNYTFGSMFNRLDDVKIDDKISIEMNGATYDYKVVESLIVEPTQVNVLDQPTDKKEITLITCHPLYTGTHRLIVKGELIESAHE